jgi:hypothetical protein
MFAMETSEWALNIQGLVLHENVITEEEQAAVVAAVDGYADYLHEHWGL